MRIIDTYDIEIKGSLWDYEDLKYQDFKVEDDHGKVWEIQIPDYPILIECFRWLSDHDSLRHLISLAPDYEDNLDVIKSITNSNEMKREHAYLLGHLTHQIDPVTLTARTFVDGLEAVPTLRWRARWVFRDRAHAAAFKLAMKL